MVWIAAAVFVASVVIWIGSAWWTAWWNVQKAYGAQVAGGRLLLFRYSPELLPEYWIDWRGNEWPPRGIDRNDRPFRWWFSNQGQPNASVLRIPLWVFSLLAAGGFVAAVCMDRAARSLPIRPWVAMRWFAKWTMTFGALAVAALWVASLLWSFQWRAPKREYEVGVWCGRISLHVAEAGGVLAHDSAGEQPGLHVHRYGAPRVLWWFETGAGGGKKWLYVPLWMVALSLGAGAAWMWRTDLERRRRRRLGCSCGYSRAGLAEDAKCPECGAEGTMRVLSEADRSR